MRSVSPIVQSLIGSDQMSVFVLVIMTFTNMSLAGVPEYTTVKHCNLPYDVEVAGLGSFSSANGLKSIDAPNLSSVVDREAYKLIYEDLDMSLRTMLENNASGAPCSVYLGFVNTSEGTVAGYEPGEPILNAAHMILAYRGIVDTYGYTVDDDGEVLVSIECSSPMADLDMKRTIMSTDSMQRGRYPADWCFRDLHVGSAQVQLLWGKI